MMDTIKQIVIKYVSQIALILTVAGLGYFAYNLWKDNQNQARRYQELIGTVEKYQKLTSYTAKLEVDYKAQKELLAKTKQEFSEVVSKKDEQIKLLSDATYLMGRHVNKQNGPDYYFETPGRTRNYVFNEVHLAGEDSPPIGFVMIKNDGRTYKGNYDFEIRVKTLQTQDEKSGKVKVYSKAFLVAKENGLAEKRRPDLKKWKDVEYPLEIVGGTALVDPTQKLEGKRFHWWAPRFVGGFDVGVSGGAFRFKPDLGASFMGYGYSRRDLDWRFLQLGMNVDTDFSGFGVSAVPFAYRPLPSILTNTYFGPGVGTSKNGTFFFVNTSLSF